MDNLNNRCRKWFISDTHFDHKNIIRFCGRPFSNVSEMNETMICNWNNVVRESDLVFHLGDFGSPRCRDPRKFLKRLNGIIILIKGNHDKSRMLKHMPIWVDRMCMRIGDYYCLLNHKPYYPKSKRGKNDRHNDHDGSIVNPEKYDFIISGHIHEKALWNDRSFNVSVEQHNYVPISEERLIVYLKSVGEKCGPKQ